MREIVFIFGLLLIIISVLNLSKAPTGQIYNIKLIIGSFLIILVGQKSLLAQKLLANKIIVFVGIISYPLYLWHVPILSFLQIITPFPPTIMTKVIVIIISFILASLTHLYLEKKLWVIDYKFLTFYLLNTLSVIGYMGHNIYIQNGYPNRFPRQEEILSTKKRGDRTDARCLELFGNKIKLNYCLSNGQGDDYIFILGDSHTEAIFDAYSSQLSKNGYNVINLGISGCPFLIGEDKIDQRTVSITEEKKIRLCNSSTTKLINIVNGNHPKGLIFVNNGWSYRKAYYQLAMIETMSRFANTIPKVLVLQNPKVPFEINHCLSRSLSSSHISDNCSYPIKHSEKFFMGYKNTVASLKESFPKLFLIDPARFLCRTDRCQVIVNGESLYSDRTHLSQIGGRYLGQKFPLNSFFQKLK